MMNFMNGESKKTEEIRGLLLALGIRRQQIAETKATLSQVIVKRIEELEAIEARLGKQIRSKAVAFDLEAAGEEWRVTLTKPRKKANIDMLEGYILVHPEAEGLIEVGPRSARIVKV